MMHHTACTIIVLPKASTTCSGVPAPSAGPFGVTKLKNKVVEMHADANPVNIMTVLKSPSKGSFMQPRSRIMASTRRYRLA